MKFWNKNCHSKVGEGGKSFRYERGLGNEGRLGLGIQNGRMSLAREGTNTRGETNAKSGLSAQNKGGEKKVPHVQGEVKERGKASYSV